MSASAADDRGLELTVDSGAESVRFHALDRVQALAMLLEYDWPGNDAELAATLLRAALVTEGEVIGVREMERIGFEGTAKRKRR